MSLALAVLILVLIFIVAAILLTSPSKGKYPEGLGDVFKSLKVMKEQGWDYLVRPDGKIDGVIVDDDEYFHEAMGEHRRKWVYYGLDGEKREEDRFMLNETTQELDDLRAISGGSGNIVLTMRRSHSKEPDAGEREPILIGNEARDRVDVKETFSAIQREQVRTIEGLRAKEQDYKSVARKYATAQNKIEELQDENESYHETVSDQSQLIDRLKSENEDLEAELEEKKRSLEQKRQELRQVESEVDETLERTRERGEKQAEAEEARA